MSYLILDHETENHVSYKRKANPFDRRNWIVARGWKKQGDTRCSWSYHPEHDRDDPNRAQTPIPDDVTLIVAHNAKFELLWEMAYGNPALTAFFRRGGRVWCTQYAEYLLQAQVQSAQMAALDDIVESYGGRKKIDGVKALWEAGVLTSEINEDLLIDYLVGTEEEGRNSGDIGNTELVFLGQIAEARENDMLPAIMARMDGLCCTSEMEKNGLKIDVKEAGRRLAILNKRLSEADAELQTYVEDMPEGLTFNWNSTIHKSALLFGGTIKYEKQAPYLDEETGELARKKATADWPLFDGEPVDPDDCEFDDATERYVRYENVNIHGDLEAADRIEQDTFKGGKKKGQPKFKKVPVPGEIKVKYQDFFHTLPGYTKPEKDWKGSQKDGAGKPIYSTGADVIEQLANRNVPFLKVLGHFTALTKEIGTYYAKQDPGTGEWKGMLTCVVRETHHVHHKLNHTSTVTTRLSSSDPNLQNVTRADFDADTGEYKSEVKRMFVSRFGEDGEMVEADYSQLEVVVQGLLSRDKNLCRDLINGVDFHCKRVSLKNSVSYEFALNACKNEEHPEYSKWKKERTRCKIFSFQRAYGAGAALIADSTGMGIEEVKELMTAEDAEYPGVVKFNKAVEKECNDTAEFFRDPQRGFRVFRRGQWQAPTGTLYSWRSFDAPDFLKGQGITDTFSPTELKNYPVQGTGGELVQMVLGRLWRRFVETNNYGGKAFLVNTVHDCIWADVHKDVRDQVCADIKRIMESIPELLTEIFGITSPVPFPVDVETGPNMLELHHWTPMKEAA